LGEYFLGEHSINDFILSLSDPGFRVYEGILIEVIGM
jgi:hypothetical protein